MVRAITHIHTGYSWDSLMATHRVVDELRRLDIELALVTDHDSFEGSHRVADRAGEALIVPTAAEIRTDRGDLIVAYPPGTSPPPVAEFKSWDSGVRVARETGALLWLPHPYRSHVDVDALAADVDVIEVFNARCSRADNARAEHLATSSGRQAAYGADAHLLRELAGVVVEYAGSGPALQVLASQVEPIRAAMGRKSDRMLAEVINGVKRKRPALAGYFAARYVKHRAKEMLTR
jgi:predicted metal-dependent phosphoesterase TrpH